MNLVYNKHNIQFSRERIQQISSGVGYPFVKASEQVSSSHHSQNSIPDALRGSV